MAAKRDEITNGHRRSSAEIRRDVEQTRAEMDATLSQLETRLSGRSLGAQVRATLEDKVRRSRIAQTLRLFPGASAVTAAGLASAAAGAAYLFAEGSDEENLRRKQARKDIEELPRETAGGRLVREEPWAEGGREGEGLGEKAHELKEAAAGKARQVAGKARDIKAKARGALWRAKEAVGGTVENLKEGGRRGGEKVSQLAGEARHQAQRAGHGLWKTFQDHPLTAGAAVLAAGVAAAALVPSTRAEDELMGEKRDELLEQAKDVGGEFAQRGARVAEAAVGAATDAAKGEAGKQDLTGSYGETWEHTE